VAVTALARTGTLGTVTSQSPVVSGASRSQQFAVAIANTAAPGDVTLTLSASDGFSGRAATTQTKTVTILRDTTAPVITITAPTQPVQEATNGTFVAEAVIVDNEVGVKTAKATWEGIVYNMAAVAGKVNTFNVTLPIPDVDGADPVAKTLKITATDVADNSNDATSTVFVKPLIDPAALTVSWVCASPNAMFLAGTSVKLRVSAVGASPQNGVSRIEFTVDANPTVTVTASIGSNQYETTYQIPAADAAGTVHNVL